MYTEKISNNAELEKILNDACDKMGPIPKLAGVTTASTVSPLIKQFEELTKKIEMCISDNGGRHYKKGI